MDKVREKGGEGGTESSEEEHDGGLQSVSP